MNETKLNPFHKAVRLFHKTFGHVVNDKPTVIDLETAKNRSIYEVEELVELLHASSKNDDEFDHALVAFKEGIEKAITKSKQDAYPANNLERIIAQTDALVDGLYFKMGDFAVNGTDPQPVFDIVQGANMSKLGADGKPIIGPNNKIMKPDGWQPPEPAIKIEIERQMRKAEPVDFPEIESIWINKVDDYLKENGFDEKGFKEPTTMHYEEDDTAILGMIVENERDGSSLEFQIMDPKTEDLSPGQYRDGLDSLTMNVWLEDNEKPYQHFREIVTFERESVSEPTATQKLAYLKSKGYDITEDQDLTGGSNTYSVDEIDEADSITTGTLVDSNTECDNIIYSISHPDQKTTDKTDDADEFIKVIHELYAQEKLMTLTNNSVVGIYKPK